jgi:hypothetical protein
MKSVVLGAAVAATLTAAVPASGQVAVRDREDVIIRDHEHSWNRHRSWYSRPCRVPHHARSDALAEW